VKKNHELHIMFHNPNSKIDSENLAKEFISRAASKALFKIVFDKMEKQSEDQTFESYCDLH